METFKHTWLYDGRTITFSWVGPIDVTARRVYALTFAPDGSMLLVGDGKDSLYWLPGGGVEGCETPEEALSRELAEEAGATALAMGYLGAQRVDNPETGSEYQAFYWCRIKLAEVFIPQHEIGERRLVSSDEFLDLLFWGRADPKEEMLLEQALQADRRYASQSR